MAAINEVAYLAIVRLRYVLPEPPVAPAVGDYNLYDDDNNNNNETDLTLRYLANFVVVLDRYHRQVVGELAVDRSRLGGWHILRDASSHLMS